MESSLQYSTSRHPDHDMSWVVVCAGHGGVLCVACLVEQLEERNLPLIQRRIVLSILAGLLKEPGEVSTKFGSNVLLSRHVMDIVTDHFFSDEQYVEAAVEVCLFLLEASQAEDLLWYIVDKFHFQLQSSGNVVLTTPYLLLLGQLLLISPAYGFHLLDKHETLLLLLLQLVCETGNEGCQCSVVYILIQLFHDTLHSDMSPRVRGAAARTLILLLSDAETLDLRVNLLALLKKMLRQTTVDGVQSLMVLGPDNKSLAMALKRMFITKQEVLQTAAAQCVHGLVARSGGEVSIVKQILDSDLAEFLFESLHTHNCPQLNSVYECLHILSSHEQFFTRCHAVYGVEAVLRSLGVILDMKNLGLAEKGFSLLANFLESQPSSMPLFVNVRSVRQCVHLIKQGLTQSHPAVFLQALAAARATVRQEYVPWPASCDVMHEMVTSASAQITALHTARDGHRQAEQDSTVGAFIQLVTESCRLCSVNTNKINGEDNTKTRVDDTLGILVSAAETHLLPWMETLFSAPDCTKNLQVCIGCVNVLTSAASEKTGHILLSLVNSGLLVKAQIIKSTCERDSELCEMLISLLEKLYQFLLSSSTPLFSTLPSWLITGLDRLHLDSVDMLSLQQAVSEGEDTSWTTLTMLYFSFLHNCSCLEIDELQSVLKCFLTRSKDLTHLPPLVIRCLTFLTACTSDDGEWEYSSDLLDLVEVLESCPPAVWFTHHPVLVSWVFSHPSTTQCLGHSLLEQWLPLLDLSSLAQSPETNTSSETGPQEKRVVSPDVELLEDLSHSPGFFNILLSMLVVPEETARAAMIVADHLMNRMLKSLSTNKPKLDAMADTCNTLFNQLFLQDNPPQEHQVNYLLKVMTQLIARQDTSCSAFDVKVVYHVVKYTSSAETDGCIEACLGYLLQYTQDVAVADCLSVGPILYQNKEFMQVLELHLHRSSDLAAQLVAWLAGINCQRLKPPHQIHIDSGFLLRSITTGSEGIQLGSLSLVYASLCCEASRSGVVVFNRESILEHCPLYTETEVRTLYFHLQQLICQDSIELFSAGLKCIHALYSYCETLHDSLATYLSSHPWNSLWFENLLHTSQQDGSPRPETLGLIDMLSRFPPGQRLVGERGEMLLQSLLKWTLQSEQRDTVNNILSQCHSELERRVEPNLLQQVQAHLQAAC